MNIPIVLLIGSVLLALPRLARADEPCTFELKHEVGKPYVVPLAGLKDEAFTKPAIATCMAFKDGHLELAADCVEPKLAAQPQGPLPLELKVKNEDAVPAALSACLSADKKLLTLQAVPPKPAAAQKVTPSYASELIRSGSSEVAISIAGVEALQLAPNPGCKARTAKDQLLLSTSCVDRRLKKRAKATIALLIAGKAAELPAALSSSIATRDGKEYFAVELVPDAEKASVRFVDGVAELVDPAQDARWSAVWIKNAWRSMTPALLASFAGERLLASRERGQVGVVTLEQAPAISRESACPPYDEVSNTIGWCPKPAGSDAVCFDVVCSQESVLYAPQRLVIQPNRGMVVHVRHFPDQDVDVTMEGERGLIAQHITVGDTMRTSGTEQGATDSRVPIVSSFQFSPRKPGPADVVIKVESEGDKRKPVDRKLDLQVEPLSWGAARFGFAALFGDVVPRKYEAQLAAGSMQYEIAETESNDLGWEVTVGLAPYLLDLIACPGGGRSHTGGCNMRVAPYFGIGIVGDAAAGVSSFDALLVGAELEFTSSLSVAATAVWRSGIGTLRRGYAEGSAVELTTPFSEKTSAVGFALVINVTPDFLSFALGTAGKEGSDEPATTPPPEKPAEDESEGGGGGSTKPPVVTEPPATEPTEDATDEAEDEDDAAEGDTDGQQELGTDPNDPLTAPSNDVPVTEEGGAQ